MGHELNDLIERAAKLVGANRTDFILAAARRAAQDVLLDRPIVLMCPKAFRKFVTRVNAPPRPNAERMPEVLRSVNKYDKHSFT